MTTTSTALRNCQRRVTKNSGTHTPPLSNTSQASGRSKPLRCWQRVSSPAMHTAARSRTTSRLTVHSLEFPFSSPLLTLDLCSTSNDQELPVKLGPWKDFHICPRSPGSSMWYVDHHKRSNMPRAIPQKQDQTGLDRSARSTLDFGANNMERYT